MLNASRFFLIFLFYSFVGYVCEVIFCSIKEKRFVNRGFLFGPVCPIYGFGAVFILLSLLDYKDNPIIVFVLGMIITSILEYYTSYILEKIFHNKWWDYSQRPDNINGRICLTNIVYFGIMALAAIYVVQPILDKFFHLFSNKIFFIVTFVLFFIFIIDLISSIIIAYNLKERLVVAEELKNEKLKILPNMLEKKYQNQISKIKFRTNRLIKVYPNLSKGLQKELKIVRNWVTENKEKLKKSVSVNKMSKSIKKRQKVSKK